MMKMMYEEKTIAETDGYTVDTLGIVRNKNRRKIGYNSNGYRKVTITKSSKRKSYYVHVLVAEAFIPKPDTEDKLEVNHIGKDTKCDNRVENLEWVTSSQNKQHAYTKGENKLLTYFSNPEKEVTAIWMLKFNEPKIFATTIKSRLNVLASVEAIRDILNGKSWTNITDELSKKFPLKHRITGNKKTM
jgi:hypothetical protein